MFKNTLSRAAAQAERKPLIKFLGKRTIPASVDHTPQIHPESPSSELPAGFGQQQSSSPSFSAYRQHAQQHGPLGRSIRHEGAVGSVPGRDLGPVAASIGVFFDRSELPLRFRRTPYTEAEIEAIETGGATLVC